MSTVTNASEEMHRFLAAAAARRALWGLQAEHLDGSPAHKALEAPLKLVEGQREEALRDLLERPPTIENALELAKALRLEWYDVDKPISEDTCHETMPGLAHILMRMLLNLGEQRTGEPKAA